MFTLFLRATAALSVLGLLSFSSAFCMMEGIEERSSQQSAKVSLPEAQQAQVENVGKFAMKRKEDGQTVQLILGSTNWFRENESNRERRPFFTDGSWICFDDLEHNPDPKAPPFICGNFNDLNLLNTMATYFPETLDRIVVDDSTYKFATWSRAHVLAFSKMLNTKGEFIYCPQGQYSTLERSFLFNNEAFLSNNEEIMEHVRTYSFSADVLPSAGLIVPRIQVDPKEMIAIDEEKVEREFKSYELLSPFLSLEEDEFGQKYAEIEELEELIRYSSDVVGNKELLKETLINKEKKEKKERQIKKRVFKEILLPESKKFLENFFETVEIKEGIPFPVPSNYKSKDTLCTIIVAKNPKASLPLQP